MAANVYIFGLFSNTSGGFFPGPDEGTVAFPCFLYLSSTNSGTEPTVYGLYLPEKIKCPRHLSGQ